MMKLIFDCLSRRAEQWVKEWNRTSADRKRLSNPIAARLLRRAGERPAFAIFLIWLVAVCLTIAAGWVIPKYLGIALKPSTPYWDIAELLTYFSTLWTLQGTIAALVYPIVIAFVAVLLQKRTTAELSLRLYFLDSAVIPAGMSAIALLIWMGLQYASLSYIRVDVWLAAAMLGNTFWFILNGLLTGWFLYRTVRYVDEQSRLQVFTHLAVHVAFPREVREHLMGLIISNAQAQKILPGDDYMSDKTGPKVVLYPLSVGIPCLKVYIEREQAIVDVRLRMLAYGISLWLRQARNIASTTEYAGLQPQSPLLEIPIVPGQTVDGEVILCRVKDGKPPGRIASFLIKHSFVFGPPPHPDTSYSTSEILEELVIEALSLAEQKRFGAARLTIRALADLHVELIRSGSFRNDKCEQDNAALLPDPYGFGSLKIHQAWLRVYRPIAEVAVRNLSLDSTLYSQYCYLASRLVHSLKGQHIEILTYLSHLSANLMYQLGEWWSEKVEERGIEVHDALHGVLLPLPAGGTYDRALQTLIEGWEALDLREHEDAPTNPDEAWTRYTQLGRFAANKSEQTVRMLLGAVVRGDRAAALWLADSFLKWWDNIQHSFDRYPIHHRGQPLLTFACVGKKWNEVRMMLDAVPEGQQEISLVSEVVSTVLRRYWTDLRFVLILILLDWTPARAKHDAFTLELAIALLQGRNLKHGGHVDADAMTNAPPMLFSLFRMQLADREYEQMLDKVVDTAQELRRPGMVSGRIYRSSGANDVESLCLAQAQVLSAITTSAKGSPHELTIASQGWANDLQQLQRFNRLAQQLKDCTDSEAFGDKVAITSAIRDAIGLPANLEEARGWVSATLNDLSLLAIKTLDETLGSAQVSQARLNMVAKAVSDFALGPDNKEFPFSISPIIKPVSDAGSLRQFTISGVSKAPYTEPQLDVGGTSIQDWFDEHVAKAIASGLVADYIKESNTAHLRNDTAEAFFDDLTSKAETISAGGQSPLLLVPERSGPNWAYPWRYQLHDSERPANVSVHARKQDDVPSLLGYFNNIPVHRFAAEGSKCFMVPEEHFRQLCYAAQDGACVAVSTSPEANNKLLFRFQWAFSAR